MIETWASRDWRLKSAYKAEEIMLIYAKIWKESHKIYKDWIWKPTAQKNENRSPTFIETLHMTAMLFAGLRTLLAPA